MGVDFTSARWVACVAAAAVLIGTGVVFAGDRQSPVDASNPAVAAMLKRDQMGSRLVAYSHIEDALPNTFLRVVGVTLSPVSELLVLGRVVEVRPGDGFFLVGDSELGTRVRFDDPRAMWRTTYVTFQVAQVIAGRLPTSANSNMTVGLAIGSTEDFASFRSGLLRLPRLALPLTRAAVFRHEASAFAVVEDGSLVLAVDDQGRLSLPFLSSSVRSNELLKNVRTLDQLREAAASPPTSRDVEARVV